MKIDLNELRDILWNLIPTLCYNKDRSKVVFYKPDIDHDPEYNYITENKDYDLIVKMINRIAEIITEDINSLERDFHNDVFQQLVKEFNL